MQSTPIMKIKAIQIQPHGIVTDNAGLAEAQTEFAARHSVLLSEVVEPALLVRLLKLLADVPLRERVPGKSKGRIIARELCVERDAMVLQALTLLFNKPEIFRVVEQITGCPKISSFLGRIYMMRPDSGHYDTWHSDVDGNRLIGLSLNLSGEQYSGGSFQIRERKTERILNRIANTITGDAHIFNISPEFQHCVAPVRGQVTKIAFAGWFQLR